MSAFANEVKDVEVKVDNKNVSKPCFNAQEVLEQKSSFRQLIRALALFPKKHLVKNSDKDLSRQKKGYCSQYRKNGFEFLKDRAKLNGFRNHTLNGGGLFDGGVCWWHSRLERSSYYLTVYRSDLPKPTEEEAYEILRTLSRNSQVVEIPGFDSFREFSKSYPHVFQLYLNDWMSRDAVFRFSWIRGLSGRSILHPEKLKKKMDELFNDVTVENKVVYQKLQDKEILSAHSWLVVDMKKTLDEDKEETGYTLFIRDSNGYDVKEVQYQIGDTYLRDNSDPYKIGDYYFVPITERNGDFRKIKKAIDNYCGGFTDKDLEYTQEEAEEIWDLLWDASF